MLALIIRTLKSQRNSLIVYLFICAAFAWMFVAFFPSISNEAEKLREAFESYPDAMLKAFSINMDQMFDSLEGFLSVEYYSIIWPIVLIVLVISYASSAIAGEIDQGTIELLLSQPVSRIQLYLAKYLSGVISIAIVVVASNLVVIPFAILHSVEYHLDSLLYVSVIGFLFTFAFYCIGFMFSSIFSAKGKVAAFTGGIALLMYTFQVISSFKESVESIKYLSFFYYFDYHKAMFDKIISWESLMVFLSVSIICTILGAIAFIKRDIAV